MCQQTLHCFTREIPNISSEWVIGPHGPKASMRSLAAAVHLKVFSAWPSRCVITPLWVSLMLSPVPPKRGWLHKSSKIDEEKVQQSGQMCIFQLVVMTRTNWHKSANIAALYSSCSSPRLCTQTLPCLWWVHLQIRAWLRRLVIRLNLTKSLGAQAGDTPVST